LAFIRAQERAAAYARRIPEEIALCETVRARLETFPVRTQAGGRSVPAFVERVKFEATLAS